MQQMISDIISFLCSVIEQNGSRIRQKYAATLSRNLPFPEIDNSIFQVKLLDQLH